MKLRMIDLFSGIGGFSLAASWTGVIETVAFCEIDPYCQRVLHKHWQSVPIYPDIRELNGYELVREHGTIDIICGGFPCQPYSISGKRRGKEDDRHLWPQMFRIIQETKPTWVIGENVANFVNMDLEASISDLESEGYEVQPFIIPACAVNAPHRRDRVWILGYSECGRCGRESRWGTREIFKDRYISLEKIITSNPSSPRLPFTEQKRQYAGSITQCDWWAIEPDVGRVAYGVPHRVDRLKGLGNAIVPKVAYQIFRAIVETERAFTGLVKGRGAGECQTGS